MQYDNQAPLKLTAITLRGIGSYIGGTRLEIRPLTILCGANGSGKSTWLRTLAMLWRSRDTLPFQFQDEVDSYESALNAYVIDELSSEDLESDSPGSVSEYGPFGCVGLEFETTQPIELPTIPSHDWRDASKIRGEANFVDELFRNGHVPQNTKIRIRLVDFPGDWDGVSCMNLVELKLGETTLQFWKTCQEPGHQLWTDFAGVAPSERLTKIGEITIAGGDVKACTPSESWNPHIVSSIAEVSIVQIEALLSMFLRGLFYVSDVRQTHKYKSISDIVCLESGENAVRFLDRDPQKRQTNYLNINDSRYVGPSGEATFVIERLYAYSAMKPVGQQPSGDFPLVTEAYVSYWLNELTGVKVMMTGDLPVDVYGRQPSLCDKWTKAKVAANGILIHDRPVIHNYFGSGTAQYFPSSNGPTCGPEKKWDQDPTDLKRFSNPCFQQIIRSPARFSAGFHQIAPIVVQSAVMLRNEILCIENPEVHLHPSMQLAVAEFLMRQVDSGRTIIIETHSDLIVRRVMREILEENIPLGQESVRLYFSDINNEKEGYSYSTLSPLSINQSGQIENWPEGFLADDVEESQRLMDVMYGSQSKDDNNA